MKSITDDARLPVPDDEARAVSERLCARIRAEIKAAGGFISFARYMELALYAPGLGYYAGGTTKFGPAGDFVTAPELTPLFGAALARAIAPMLAETGGEILELGAGSGWLALDLASALAELDAPFTRYAILEPSPTLKATQERLLRGSSLRERVVWLDRLPERFCGVVIANEVLDALPVHLIVGREGAFFERGVGWENDRFVWREAPLADERLRTRAKALALSEGYVIELAPAREALVSSLAERMTRGIFLIIDYGFGAREYYHPQRHMGTLTCHYRHHRLDDPFLWPGLVDITAHVEFTSLAHAASRAGLELLTYTTQAHFLIACGIAELAAQLQADHPDRYLSAAQSVGRLLSPAEMGELFKVLCLGCNVSSLPAPCLAADRRHRL